MKKYTIIAIMILSALLCSFVLASCDSDAPDQSGASRNESNASQDETKYDIFVAEDAIYYNLVNTGPFGFAFPLYTAEKVETVEFVDAAGKNTDKVTDWRVKKELDYSSDGNLFEGYYFCALSFFGTPYEEADIVEITQLRVKINGKDVTITPKFPIIHDKRISELNNDCSCIMDGGRPLMITGSAIKMATGEYPYGFTAIEDITLTGVTFPDVIGIKQAILSVEGRTVGVTPNLFPVTIKEGDGFSLKITFEYVERDGPKVGIGVYSNVIIEYTVNETGEKLKYYVPFTSQAISNDNEASILAKYYFGSDTSEAVSE